MPLLNDKNLIFIHVPKCAGTSVSDSLNMSLLGHYTAEKRVAQQPKHPHIGERGYTSFAIVRNPWDRLVSAYEYCQMKVSSHYKVTHEDYHILGNCSFEKTIEIIDTHRHILKHPGWFDQYDWIYGYDDKQKVDKVFKYENLNQELPRYLKDNFNIDLNLSLLNKSNRTDYKKYYNELLIEKVRKIYYRDIVTFGYTYE